MKPIITKDSLISEIIKNYPKAIELLSDYGLTCANCFFNKFDNIENGAKLHGMTDDEINKMIIEVNKILRKEKK